MFLIAVFLIAALLLLLKPTSSEKIFHPVPPLPLPLPSTDPYPSAPFLKPLPNSSDSTKTSINSTCFLSNTLQQRNIIGTDDREPWTSTTYPYSAMGRLETLNLSPKGQPLTRSLCTATLIGPRHVATAAHCVQTTPNTLSKVRFQPSFDECESASGGSFATFISVTDFKLNSGDCASYSDIAVLVLQDRLGDELGFLTPRLIDERNEVGLGKAVWNTFGYPVDKGKGERPVRQRGVSVVNVPGSCGKGNPVVTNADVGQGMSGGPLWNVRDGEYVLVGVLSTSVSGRTIPEGSVSAYSGGQVLVENTKGVREKFS